MLGGGEARGKLFFVVSRMRLTICWFFPLSGPDEQRIMDGWGGKDASSLNKSFMHSCSCIKFFNNLDSQKPRDWWKRDGHDGGLISSQIGFPCSSALRPPSLGSFRDFNKVRRSEEHSHMVLPIPPKASRKTILTTSDRLDRQRRKKVSQAESS